MTIKTPMSPSEEKVDKVKQQVVEVTEILQENVDRMKNRGEAFDSMQAKSSRNFGSGNIEFYHYKMISRLVRTSFEELAHRLVAANGGVLYGCACMSCFCF